MLTSKNSISVVAHECRGAAAPPLPAAGRGSLFPRSAHAPLANMIYIRPSQVPDGSLLSYTTIPYSSAVVRIRIRDSVFFLACGSGSWLSNFRSRILDPGSWIPDLGSRILDPGSRISDHESWIPDLGSRISDPPTHISDSLATTFCVKNTLFHYQLVKFFFLYLLKNKWFFVEFMATKLKTYVIYIALEGWLGTVFPVPMA